MANFTLQIEVRTVRSEAYNIIESKFWFWQKDSWVGRLDIHHTDSVVYGSIFLDERLDQTKVQELAITIQRDLPKLSKFSFQDLLGVKEASAPSHRQDLVFHLLRGRLVDSGHG